MAKSSTDGKGCFTVLAICGGGFLALVVVALTWPILMGVGVVAFGYWIAKKQTLTDQTRGVLIGSAVVVLIVAGLGEMAWLSQRSKPTTVQTASSSGPASEPTTTRPAKRSAVGAVDEPTTTTAEVLAIVEPSLTTTAQPPTTAATLPPTTAAPVTEPPPPPPPPTTVYVPPTTVYVPPTTVAPAVGGGCNPNYTPCVPNASDVDCLGGSGNGPAYVAGPVTVIGSDPYGLDSDGDGIGCEG